MILNASSKQDAKNDELFEHAGEMATSMIATFTSQVHATYTSQVHATIPK